MYVCPFCNCEYPVFVINDLQTDSLCAQCGVYPSSMFVLKEEKEEKKKEVKKSVNFLKKIKKFILYMV